MNALNAYCIPFLRFFIPRHISHKPGVLCPPGGWCRLGLGIKWAVNNDKYTAGTDPATGGGDIKIWRISDIIADIQSLWNIR